MAPIDSKYKSVSVSPGKHVIKVKKHHDFFIDWFVDDKLIEEFILFDLVSDNDSVLIINSSDNFDINNSEKFKIINKQNNIPFSIHLNKEQVEFDITCIKPSQISFFMQKEYTNITTR